MILEHFLVETTHGDMPITQAIYYISSVSPVFTGKVHHAVVELPTGYLAIETSSPGSGAEKAMNMLLENIAFEKK